MILAAVFSQNSKSCIGLDWMQKSKLWSHKHHDNTFCSIRMHHNLPFLMEKTAKNGHFLVKKCFFWPQTSG